MRTTMMAGALALGAMACNPPEAKDSKTLFIQLDSLAPGAALAVLELRASVDADARELSNGLEVSLSTFYESGTTQDIELALLEGLTEIGSDVWSEGTARINVDLDFASCEPPAFTVLEDGGCEYLASVWIGADDAYTVFVDADLRTQAPDDWTGDPDSLEVAVELTHLQGE